MRYLAILIWIFSCSNLSFAQTQKIGHVNSQKFLDTLSETKQLAEQLAKYEQSLTATGEQMIQKFQENARKYQQDVKAGNLTPLQQKDLESSLEVEQNAIGKYQQSAQESLNKRRQELLAPLLNRIDEAIKAIGKEASYTFIFDSSAGLIFYPESEDITPLILKKLNAPK